jgi:hypothetical protein
LIYQNKKVTAKTIKDIYTGKTNQAVLLSSYLSKHVEYLKNTSTHTPSTIENYEKGFKHIDRFIININIETV